jgi:hypothetical protein
MAKDLTSRKLSHIVDEMFELNQIEDRREYDQEMLMRMYDLTEQEAEDLHYLVQRVFDQELQTGNDPTHIPSWVHKEFYLESSELEFEGFTDHERAVIIKYYDYMCKYWQEVRNESDRDPVTGRQLNCTYGSPEADV